MACGISGSGKSFTMIDLVTRWVKKQINAPGSPLLHISIGALEHHKGQNGKGVEKDLIRAIQDDGDIEQDLDGILCA
jgi:hypothetical protein